MSSPLDRVGIDILTVLKAGLNAELPGHAGFLKYSGFDHTRMDKARALDESPRLSAVLICLYKSNGKLYTTLMKRPAYDGAHSGQIAFPGGRKEPEDTNLSETAFREFQEETGASTQGFELLGKLSELYIPVSRSLVTPYVAVYDGSLSFKPDPKEVERLIEVPFSKMIEPDILKHTDKLAWAINKKLEVPYFDIANEVVWGATALMIAELRAICGVKLD